MIADVVSWLDKLECATTIRRPGHDALCEFRQRAELARDMVRAQGNMRLKDTSATLRQLAAIYFAEHRLAAVEATTIPGRENTMKALVAMRHFSVSSVCVEFIQSTLGVCSKSRDAELIPLARQLEGSLPKEAKTIADEAQALRDAQRLLARLEKKEVLMISEWVTVEGKCCTFLKGYEKDERIGKIVSRIHENFETAFASWVTSMSSLAEIDVLVQKFEPAV